MKRAIENSKTYEELPPRVRTLLPIAEWKAKYAILLRSLSSFGRCKLTTSFDIRKHADNLLVCCLSESKSTAFRKALAGMTVWQVPAAQSQSITKTCSDSIAITTE